MAKRVAKKIKSLQTPLTSVRTRRSGTNYRSVFNSVVSSPTTMWIAGGIGVAVIARFAYKYYQSHPEISDYIRENFETVENKLSEYKSQLTESLDLADARDRH